MAMCFKNKKFKFWCFVVFSIIITGILIFVMGQNMYPSIIITLITILILFCLFWCLHKKDETQTVVNETQEQQIRVEILLPNSRNEDQGQNEVDSPPKPNDEHEILTNNYPPPSYEEAISSHQK